MSLVLSKPSNSSNSSNLHFEKKNITLCQHINNLICEARLFRSGFESTCHICRFLFEVDLCEGRNCSGYGNCSAGVCNCDDGFTGTDCESKIIQVLTSKFRVHNMFKTI